MRIVAVAASQQSFVHAMMRGLGELRLHFPMTSVAQHGLRHDEERALDFRFMRRVAIDAAHVVLQMFGAQKICVFFAKFVATQAAPAGFLARQRLEADDLGYIPTALDVFLSGTVACFATLELHATM